MRAAQPPSSWTAAAPALAPLPAPVRAAVRSQAVITTVAEALAEVVANALDAGATEVNVDVALAPEALGFRVQDNGAGVPAASMPLLGQRFATSKAPLVGSAASGGPAGAPSAACPLGYRGEALAAIREAAGALEVTSRAAGSFETLTITLQPGGRAAGPALAPEQRVRQGTVVAVRNLFAAQPVRRKALLNSGLQREAGRCCDVVLRLALLRPGVTFTLFDRSRRAFVLRLIKGRSELDGVTEFLGRLPQLVAALQPAPAAGFAVSGYAALPPYGQPGTNRQCIYINGRWVKAAPVAKLVDNVFQQCYKPNVRLLEGQGEELQAVRKASNKHAAFVLHISCSPGEYELAHEAEGELVQFRSWEPLLAAVQHSLLAAWRQALSNSLLKQLEQLEGGGGAAAAAEGPAAAAAPAAGVAGAAPGRMSLQDWLQGQSGQESYDAIQAQTAAAAAEAAAATAAAAETAAGRSSGSGRQRGWSGGQKLSGAKHTLASRLVRYNGATALPFGAGGGSAAGASCGLLSSGQPQWESQVSRQNWEGSGAQPGESDMYNQQQQQTQQTQQRAWRQQLSQRPPGVLGQAERAPLQHQEQQQQEMLQTPAAALWQAEEPADAFSCQVLASRVPPSKQPRREPSLQPLQPLSLKQILSGEPAWYLERTVAEQQAAMAWGPASWHAQLGSAGEGQATMGSDDEQPDPEPEQLLAQLPLQMGGCGACELVEQADWWQQEQQRPALDRMDVEEQWGCEQQPEQEPHSWQQRWDTMGSSGSPCLRLGSSEEVEALISSWARPRAGKGPAMPDAWAAEGDALPLEQPAHSRRSRLTDEEQALLQRVAYSSLPSRTRQRPQSAPPHHRPRQRIEVVRRPQRMLPLAQLARRQAAAPNRPQPAAAQVAAVVAAKPPAPVPAAEQQQGHSQGTAIRQYGGSAEGAAAQGSGHSLLDKKGPAASLGGTAMQLSAAVLPQPSVAGPTAAQQAVPDFLRPDAGLDELLATWRRRAAAAQPGPAGAATAGSGNPEGILTLDALSAAAFARLKPPTLSREQLAGAWALQQVDRKFVPIVCGSLLALVDQHAADERVQLERLRDLLLGPDGQPRVASSQALRTPLPLDLTDAEQQLLEAYQHKAEAWGWRWVVPAQQRERSNGFGGQAAPVLTHGPLLWGSTLSATDLKLYLHHLHDTCGAGGLPAGVVRVLNSKACRGAIMFGDALHQGQCQGLLDNLAATQLCFSCAHGRPTTVPVVDLRLLQQALRLQAEARAAAAGGGNSGSVDGGAVAAGQPLGLSGLKARLQALVQ